MEDTSTFIFQTTPNQLNGKDSNVLEVDKGVNVESKNIVDKVDKHMDTIIDK